MDHRELVARMAVADIGCDVVALGHLPPVGGARFVVGGDRRCGAHRSIIAPRAIRLKPSVVLAGARYRDLRARRSARDRVRRASSCSLAGIRARREADAPAAAGMQSALHAATSTLPHLRRGLSPRTAERAVPYLRELTGAAAIALADTRAVLAIDGEGREQVRPGDLLSRLLEMPDHRVHVVPRLISTRQPASLGGAGALDRAGPPGGTLIMFYRASGRPRSRAQGRPGGRQPGIRPGRAVDRLRAGGAAGAGRAAGASGPDLSAFHLHALAAVAGDIHVRPDEARAAERLRRVHPVPFRDGRSYVTLGEELDHVERYLRLEQAVSATACTCRWTCRPRPATRSSRRCRCNRWSRRRAPWGRAACRKRPREDQRRHRQRRYGAVAHR